MKEQSWWIYQERKVKEPWAIHLKATKSQRRIHVNTEIYADWLPTESRRMLLYDVSIAQSRTWLGEVGRILAAYGHPLTERDVGQLERELDELKKSFLD